MNVSGKKNRSAASSLLTRLAVPERDAFARRPVQAIRRLGTEIGEAFERRAASRRFYERFPSIRASVSDARSVTRQLAACYEDYVTRVSSREMAASLEVATFLAVLCQARSPGRVLDLGSGFSSLAFRMALVEQPGCVISSVDDNPHWLRKTEQYLAERGYHRPELLSWSAFCGETRPRYDLVFHDLGNMHTRAETLPQVLDAVSDGGMIVFDDVHKVEYRRVLLEQLRHRGWEVFDLAFRTLDDLRRWSILAHAVSTGALRS